MAKQRRESLLYFRIHKYEYDRFKTAANERNMTISALCRLLLDDYLAWWEQGGKEETLATKKQEQQAEVQL